MANGGRAQKSWLQASTDQRLGYSLLVVYHPVCGGDAGATLAWPRRSSTCLKKREGVAIGRAGLIVLSCKIKAFSLGKFCCRLLSKCCLFRAVFVWLRQARGRLRIVRKDEHQPKEAPVIIARATSFKLSTHKEATPSGL
jgi:hypothetical protein